MEKKIRIKLPQSSDKSYDIIIKKGLFQAIHVYLDNKTRYVVISDRKVAALYGKPMLKSLAGNSIQVELLTFKGGERDKTRQTKEMLEDKLFKNMHDRTSVIIALGGGITGDIAGFTAATFMRGIPYIQVPTTLLAQIDSSIGGKTGANHQSGKNLIGSFHQPSLVLIDPNTLQTLSQKELLNGIAEIIKHSIIKSSTLFKELQSNIKNIVTINSDYDFVPIIWENCRIKAKVVMEDEKEGDLRRILNFGHTIGHAVEILSQGSISHGEAVSMGMVAESKMALMKGLLKEHDFNAIKELIREAGLPDKIPSSLSWSNIVSKTKHDKKTEKGIVNYSLPDRIGNCLHGCMVEDTMVKQALRAMS